MTRTPLLLLLLLILVVVALVATASCGAGRPRFGASCTSADTCDPSEMCLSGEDRCVPSRLAGQLGETCAAPIPLVATTVSVGDGTQSRAHWRASAAIGQATDDDSASSCGPGGRELFFSFNVDAPLGIALRAHVEAPHAHAAVSLRDASCVEVSFGCAPASTSPGSAVLALPLVESGVHIIAVDVDDDERGTTQERGFTLIVEQVECPPGSIFPPDASTCQGFVPVDGIPPGRLQHSSVALPNDVALITGGVDGGEVPLRAALTFDGRTDTWSSRFMDSARAGHTSGVLADGTAIVVGGLDTGGGYTDAALPFNSPSFVEPFLSNATSPPQAFITDGSLVIMPGERPLLFLGDQEPFSGRRVNFTEGRHCGADNPCDQGFACLSDVDPFNPAVCVCLSPLCAATGNAPQWDTACTGGCGTGNRNRRGALAVPLDDGSGGGLAVVVGGHDQSGMAPPALYVGATNGWVDLGLGPSVPMKRDDPRGGVIANEVIVAGGRDENGAPTDVVEIYDPVADTVLSVMHMTSPRADFAVIPFDAQSLLAVGGVSDAAGDKHLRTSDIIDVANRVIRPGPVLPAGGLSGHTASVLTDGRALVVGGEVGDDDVAPGRAPTAFLLERTEPALTAATIHGNPAQTNGAHGDDCTDAVQLTGGSGSVRGSTRGFHNDFDAGDFHCGITSGGTKGRDAVYVLHVPASSTVDVSVDGRDGTHETDFAIMVVDQCPPSTDSCAAFSDLVYGDEVEVLSFDNPDERDVFIIVDTFFVNFGNPFTLTWDIH